MACQKKPAPGSILVLGPMPLKAAPQTHIAAGPWCFAEREDFFPDWEENYLFAPDPLLDRNEEDRLIREAETLAADVIPRLSGELQPDTPLPDAYWETLLAPFTITVAKLIAQFWSLIRHTVGTWKEIPLTVELLPRNCSFTFGTDADVVLHGSLNPVCCQWILSQLLRPVLPEAWKARELESVSEEYVQSPASDFRKNVHDTLRSLMLHMPFPRMKGMTLKQALSYSSSLLHPSRYGDRSRSLKETFSSSSGCTAPDLPLDCGFIFSAMLPRSVKELRHPHSAPRRMFKPRVRAASIIAYEDAAYRQKLAIWRARGGRLLYVQHGGNYGQMKRICAMEFVEYTQHAFATWGWTEYEGSMGRKAGKGNFIPLPYPQLNRLRDAWHGQESQTLIAVGTEMPTVAYQLDSHPTPSQFIQYRDDKQWFFEALGPAIREKTLYRPYFPVPGTLQDAQWLLPRFPHVHLCSGPLEPQILSCRLLVLDHHGTTLLEAMAANIPTVCYWNPEFWPVTGEFADILSRMKPLGMWNSSAEEAAIKVRAVWDDPSGWWSSREVQNVRDEFLRHFALLPRNTAAGDRAWKDALSQL